MSGRFNVTHRRGAKFARHGLRGYFEYRDLGIKRATRGGGEFQDPLCGEICSQKVTGPSFTRLIFMCVPKCPAATRG